MNGPKLPQKLTEMGQVTTADGKGFLIVGGRSERVKLLEAIYKLVCHSLQCQWTTLPQKITTPRISLIAIWVPGEYC